MLGTNGSSRPAGDSAGRQFKQLARVWRRRVLPRVFLACSLVVVALSVASTLVSGQTKYWLGVVAGATMALYAAVRDSPPWHIEKWRSGEEGEHRTAKALRRLPAEGWSTWHDLATGSGTNIDHVVVGRAGVFLLDSKNYSGEACVDGGELNVHWVENPKDGWVCKGIVPHMRAMAAELKEAIEEATGVRIWVQPVVVLWMRFPERVAQLSDVIFVEGEAVSDWLRGRPPFARSFDATRVEEFLSAASVVGASIHTPQPVFAWKTPLRTR
jgi:hypothetical protein